MLIGALSTSVAAYCLFLPQDGAPCEVVALPLLRFHLYSIAGNVMVVSGWSGDWAARRFIAREIDSLAESVKNAEYGVPFDQGRCDTAHARLGLLFDNRRALEAMMRAELEAFRIRLQLQRYEPWHGLRACQAATVGNSFALVIWADLVGACVLCVGLLPLGLTTAQALRRRRRRRRNECVNCGYPLQGLPRPRCPECGTAFGQRAGTGQGSLPGSGTVQGGGQAEQR